MMTSNLIDLSAARERRVLTEAVPPGEGWWQDRGACSSPAPDVEKMREMSPLFDARSLKAARPALAVCAVCPVMAECFAFALVDDEFEGVAGAAVFAEKMIDGKTARWVLRPGRPAVAAAEFVPEAGEVAA